MTIYFDMDGTIAGLYDVLGWLDYILSEDSTPYMQAQPMFHFATFARMLNKLKRKGYRLGIISWTAKGGSDSYNSAIDTAKRAWLKKHLPSVVWDEIHIVSYGYPKTAFSGGNDILFDDDCRNRDAWAGTAYDVDDIIGVLKTL